MVCPLLMGDESDYQILGLFVVLDCAVCSLAYDTHVLQSFDLLDWVPFADTEAALIAVDGLMVDGWTLNADVTGWGFERFPFMVFGQYCGWSPTSFDCYVCHLQGIGGRHQFIAPIRIDAKASNVSQDSKVIGFSLLHYLIALLG